MLVAVLPAGPKEKQFLAVDLVPMSVKGLDRTIAALSLQFLEIDKNPKHLELNWLTCFFI